MILSVITVTYNNENHIISCLASLPWDNIPMEVWLIDDRSTDRTRERVEEFGQKSPAFSIHKIWNTTNQGYTRSVNQGLSLSQGEFILLLGPDTRIFPGSLETMIDFLKIHPDVGLVAPKLLDPHGRILPSCRRFPTYRDSFFELSGMPRMFPKRFIPAWKMPDFDHRSQQEIEQPEATCLMTHRKILHEVGFMDTRFPMFFSDVDWCRRFLVKGWKVVFYPEAQVEHIKGASILPYRIPMIWKSHQGFYRYFQKYYTSFWQRWINQVLGLLLIFTATFRTLMCLIQYLKRREV